MLQRQINTSSILSRSASGIRNRVSRGSASPPRERARFALDSPLEGSGCEVSVPPFSSCCADRPFRFESGSLQPRVGRTPRSAEIDSTPARTSGPLGKGRGLQPASPEFDDGHLFPPL